MNVIRDTVTRVDSAMGIANFRTMEQQLRDSLAIERFAAGAASTFAVLATALAALGLYGVLAYSVAQRSREIGLRIALGAETARIRGMVLKQVARMAAIGVVLGAIVAWALGLAAQSVLLGVEAGDPLGLAAAAALLTVVGLHSGPARLAGRSDERVALRVIHVAFGATTKDEKGASWGARRPLMRTLCIQQIRHVTHYMPSFAAHCPPISKRSAKRRFHGTNSMRLAGV